MSRFLVVTNQSGGCDYMIACGTLAKEVTGYSINAESIDEAVAGVTKKIRARDWQGVDEDIESVIVYEIAASAPVDLKAIRQVVHAARDADNAKRAEAVERETFERLKRKYEPQAPAPIRFDPETERPT